VGVVVGVLDRCVLAATAQAVSVIADPSAAKAACR
jgi:hypothetical protein